MKKILFALMISLLAIASFGETLVIKGSNTVFPVAQLWVEEMKNTHPDLQITLEGAGSSTGIAALLNGTADLANSSRWLKEKEIASMFETGRYFIPVVLGYDGIAVIVNPSLGIEEISIETLKDIYTGKISSWNQVNPNLPKNRIEVYSRNSASGTFETFSEFVLNGENMSPRTRIVESTQLELESVQKNPYAIAYTGVGYVNSEIKVLKVNGIYPDKNSILSNSYPISRALYMFIEGKKGLPSSGAIREYLNLVFSKRGQELLEQAGYISVYGQ